jgi:hypothetical protein
MRPDGCRLREATSPLRARRLLGHNGILLFPCIVHGATCERGVPLHAHQTSRRPSSRGGSGVTLPLPGLGFARRCCLSRRFTSERVSTGFPFLRVRETIGSLSHIAYAEIGAIPGTDRILDRRSDQSRSDQLLFANPRSINVVDLLWEKSPRCLQLYARERNLWRFRALLLTPR